MNVFILGNQARSVCNFWSVLIRHLRSEGHRVYCLVPKDSSSDEHDARHQLEQTADGVHTYHLKRKSVNPFSDVKTFFSLFKLFREKRPDLLFASTIKPVIYGCLAAKFAKVPRIYATITGLGYTFESDSPAKRLIHKLSVFLYTLALRGIDGVFFQNTDDRAVFAGENILGQTAVFMARGTGVDTKKFAYTPQTPRSGELTFLFVGRLLYAKGVLEYANAAQILKRDYPNARFQLLGPLETGFGGIPPATIEELTRDGIEYLGATDDVRSYLAACNVLVLPSYREGVPTAVMEAMSVGRACIVTDAPGCREVVRDGENGYIVPVRDVPALTEAMRKLLTHAQDVTRMGDAGRKRAVEHFDADAVALKIIRDMKISGREQRMKS